MPNELAKRGDSRERLKEFTHGSMRTRLAQATTGISPSEQLLGQCPRPTLDCLKSHTAERLKETRGNRKSNVISDTERDFEVGDDGFAKITITETNGYQVSFNRKLVLFPIK